MCDPTARIARPRFRIPPSECLTAQRPLWAPLLAGGAAAVALARAEHEYGGTPAVRGLNAMAESFVDSFKSELIADRIWRTRTLA